MQDLGTYDAVVIGSGPNGLAAAITLGRAGRKVLVVEGRDTVGGGMRSAELTQPGFIHDICSAIHPLALASPFFRSLPLADYGLQFIQPPAALAHPFDDGSAAMLELSIPATMDTLGCDGRAYQKLIQPLLADWEKIIHDSLGPLPLPPAHPLAMARFGLKAVRSTAGLAKSQFKGERARALFAGIAAHIMLPLDAPVSAAYGLVLALLGHAVGWPLARGGSQSIAGAMERYMRSLGGHVKTGWQVETLDELPQAGVYLFDVTPRQLLRIAGSRFPPGYRRGLERFRYGPGVFKVDWALREPIPWLAPEAARAGTVHLGGQMEEIAAAENAVWAGKHPERPFILLAQPSLFDPGRAPNGQHTAWAYCHVPHGSTFDMLERIEAQVERFAPGFRDIVLDRSTMTATAMEQYNPNYVGGDINGGVQDLWQLFTRPVARRVPYSTPAKDIFLCSSSTPPGGGVHGMCGYHAAQAALRASPSARAAGQTKLAGPSLS